MWHRVFVYGTLLAGEVNHRLLAGAVLLGPWRTPPRYTLYDLGAYPGVARSGCTAIVGEVYAIDRQCLGRLDTLEEYPRLYDREPIPTPYGLAWIYLYRGRLADRRAIPGGDWRVYASAPDSFRAAGVRGTRDSKNRRWPESWQASRM
jgi:gamma-glutamylaminecyclotransferase